MTLDQLTDEHFRPLLQQTFHLSGPSGEAMNATLIEVAAGAHMGVGRRQFSLLFRGSGEFVWPQAIYGVEHAALGKLDIFLVPVAQSSAGTDYQAVFT